MVRIAYANDGISTYDELFLTSFKEKHEVYVLTFHPTPFHVPQGVKVMKMPDIIPPTDLHPFEGARKHALAPVRALVFKSYVSKVKPDIVVGCWASTYGFYAAFSKVHPFILFVWGSDVLIFPQKYKPLAGFISYALKRADAVLVDSNVQKKAVVRLGCAESKVLKFPWVKLDEFARDSKQRLEVRKELGWTEDDVVVISMRNHKPIYGVSYLIEAIPHVLKNAPNVKFLILGEGGLTRSFKEKVKAFKAADKVRFIGMVPYKDVAKYLSAADIYVSTSFSDGTSASLLEAMACSLPSVVTSIEGNREWVQDGANGHLVPTGDSVRLAEKIISLAGDEKIRRRMAANAIETIKTGVNWQKNMDVFNEAIMKLCLKN